MEARTEREWADAGEDYPSCFEEGTSFSEDCLDRPGLGEEDQVDTHRGKQIRHHGSGSKRGLPQERRLASDRFHEMERMPKKH
jgi:hypothetical protein